MGRRRFSREFKLEAVRLGKKRGVSVVQASRDLDGGETLGVSRSGFHAWLTRSPSDRARSDEALGAQIKASFVGSDRTYGARRIWHDVLAKDTACGLHRVERLMREQALRAKLDRAHAKRSLVG